MTSMPLHERSRPLHVEVLSANALVGSAIADLLRRTPFMDAWHADPRGNGSPPPVASRPDLVLLDPESGRAGLAAELTGVRGRLGEVPVVLLLQEPEPGHRLLVRSVGVVGCCYRDLGAADLMAGLEAMATAGKPPARSRHRRNPSATAAGDGTRPARHDLLTSREADVLDLYVSGQSRKEIALALGISEHTVRSHFQALRAKLAISSKLEAAALVRRTRQGQPLASPTSELRGPVSHPRAFDSGPPELAVLVALRRSLDREAVGQTLAAIPGLGIAAGSADARSAVADAIALRPAVTLLDTDLEHGGGVAACTAIREAGAPTRTIVVSARPDLSVLEAAVEAGADGYLAASECTVDDLVAIISSVHAGGLAVPAAMLRELLLAQWRERRAERQALRRFASLTRTEGKLLTLLTEGLDHQAIANSLVVSPHTARTHIQHVLRKLGVHSRVEAANLAVRYDFAGFSAGPDPVP